MLLRNVYNEFIEDKAIDVVNSTIETYDNKYTVINRYYDCVDITSIDKKNVRDFQKYLLDEMEFSVSHINKIIGLLKQVFKFAQEQGYIEQNLISSIPMIKKQVKVVMEKTIWNLEQFEIFISNIENERDRVIFEILFFLGLRKGELLSLKWSEVCFANKTIQVISTASREKGKGQKITPPKTIKANRAIVMNDTLYEELLSYYIKQKVLYNDLNQRFVIGNEKMMCFTPLQRLLDKYLKLTNLPKITLHGFRHSNATMLAELNADIKSVSNRLGHENVQITINTYYHSSIKSQEKIANMIEEHINTYKQNKFEIFSNGLKDILIKAISSKDYNDIEIGHIINIYNMIKGEIIF